MLNAYTRYMNKCTCVVKNKMFLLNGEHVLAKLAGKNIMFHGEARLCLIEKQQILLNAFAFTSSINSHEQHVFA